MAKPDLNPKIAEQPPRSDSLTDYDEQHVVTYLRLLDAEQEGASRVEMARVHPGHRAERGAGAGPEGRRDPPRTGAMGSREGFPEPSEVGKRVLIARLAQDARPQARVSGHSGPHPEGRGKDKIRPHR